MIRGINVLERKRRRPYPPKNTLICHQRVVRGPQRFEMLISRVYESLSRNNLIFLRFRVDALSYIRYANVSNLSKKIVRENSARFPKMRTSSIILQIADDNR